MLLAHKCELNSCGWVTVLEEFKPEYETVKTTDTRVYCQWIAPISEQLCEQKEEAEQLNMRQWCPKPPKSTVDALKADDPTYQPYGEQNEEGEKSQPERATASSGNDDKWAPGDESLVSDELSAVLQGVLIDAHDEDQSERSPADTTVQP
jgi:hypothetical protein